VFLLISHNKLQGSQASLKASLATDTSLAEDSPRSNQDRNSRLIGV